MTDKEKTSTIYYIPYKGSFTQSLAEIGAWVSEQIFKKFMKTTIDCDDIHQVKAIVQGELKIMINQNISNPLVWYLVKSYIRLISNSTSVKKILSKPFVK